MITTVKYKKYSKAAIASMILGIFAIFLVFIPIVNIIFQILAISLGVIGIYQAKVIKKCGIGFAFSGLALGIIALILTIATALFASVGIKLFASIIYIFVTFTELF